MHIMDFSVEETNLIAIYIADSLSATIAMIAAALPYMDADIQDIANSAIQKLAVLTAPEFSALSFAPAFDTGG